MNNLVDDSQIPEHVRNSPYKRREVMLRRAFFLVYIIVIITGIGTISAEVYMHYFWKDPIFHEI